MSCDSGAWRINADLAPLALLAQHYRVEAPALNWRNETFILVIPAWCAAAIYRRPRAHILLLWSIHPVDLSEEDAHKSRVYFGGLEQEQEVLSIY